MKFSGIDLAIMAAYLIGITIFGVAVGYRRNSGAQQYFLANRSLGWFTVGAAVFTSNISTLHLVGLAAGGAKDGMVLGNFEWMACFTLILLALVFAPLYIRSGVQTLPEYMERRYGPSARTFLAIIGLLGALLVHIGISLFAAAKLFESFLGLPMLPIIVTLSLFTVVYTALGGLRAVVLTESIQACLLLAGAAMITFLGFRALHAAGVHGWSGLTEAALPGQMRMIKPVHEAGRLNGYSWLAVLLGYPILGVWYWCADQTHVQRVLGARDQQAGQNGALFAGFLKITPVFLMVLPGVIGSVLWRKGLLTLGVTPGTGAPDFNTMLPALINLLVPVGFKGLLAACMAAALMSCMAAALNSCATLVSLDIVRRIRPQTPERRLVLIGRISTAVVMLLAMAWSTQGDQFGTIFEAINKIPMTFAPAVTTVFVLGVMWPRGNRQAAMATLYAGTLVGVVYFILDLPSVGRGLLGLAASEPFGGLVSDPHRGLGAPFMLVGPMLTALCAILYVAVALSTPRPEPEKTDGLVWARPLDLLRGPLKGVGDPRLVSLALCVTVACLYVWLH